MTAGQQTSEADPAGCRAQLPTQREERNRPALLLRVAGLALEAGLAHAFSTSALGSMRSPGPGGCWLTPGRRALAGAIGMDPENLTVVGAVHGADVARVDEPSGLIRGVDGLVTDRRTLPLLATFADCYPLLVYDPVRPALALVHAGWRGTAAGIARRAVEVLRREYGCRPEGLVAGVGPGICGRCYEVGKDVAARFDGAFCEPAGKECFRLDLAAANRRQLEAAGIRPDRIHAEGTCTRESAELPSHRRLPDGSRFACIAALR